MIIKGPNIDNTGLFFLADAGNPRSYSGSGNVWKDISGNGNHLTLVNSPTYNSAGYFNFNGTSQYASKTSVTPYTLYCVDIWFYNDDTISTSIMPGPYQALAGFGDYGMGILLGAFTGDATNETILFGDSNPGGSGRGWTYIRDTISIGLHNLIINWNGSTYDFWIDGEKKTTYSGNDGHAILDVDIRDSIFLGKEDGGSNYEFDGRIYRCAIYDQQKTDAQVLYNYNLLNARYR